MLTGPKTCQSISLGARRTVGDVGTPTERAMNAINLALGSLILRELRHIDEGITLVSDASARIETALSGIQGDIDGLKSSAANLQTALDDALAAQPQDVQDQINAAVSQAQDAFDAQLDTVASKLEDLDAQTQGAGVDPGTENPVDQPHPDQTLPGDLPPQ